MCNKCESTTTGFLRYVANRSYLKANSRIQWQHAVRQLMKVEINSRNAPSSRDMGMRDAYKSNGAQVAKTRAIALKSTAMTRTPMDILEATPVLDYLTAVIGTSARIEPKYIEAVNNVVREDWEAIMLHELVGSNEPYKQQHVNKIQLEIDTLHLLHVSTEDPMMVAYYPTLRHAREGREVRTKLGKYLTHFMGMYQLTHSDVKDMVEKHAANMQSRGAWTVEFIDHNDPDGWQRIYNTCGIDTCMSGKAAIHVYANELSELRLAYIMSGDTLVARCIVRDDPNEANTGWLRMYPDPNGYAEGRFMLDWLEANGYPNRTNLDGCLLTAEDGNGNNYVCPYLDSGNDGDQTVEPTRVNGCEYLRVGNGSLDANNTNGYTEGVSCCDECGSQCNEDELTYIESDSVNICESCRSDGYVYAYGSRYEEWMPINDCVEVGDYWYSMEYAGNHDIYYCERSEQWMHADDMVSTDEGMINVDYAAHLDHEYGGYEYAYEGDVVELSDGTTCHTDDVVELSDGTTCHTDDEEELQATIDFDTQDEPTNVGVSTNETTGAL